MLAFGADPSRGWGAVLGQLNATEEDFDLTIEAAASGWWYRCPSTPTKQQIVFLSDVDLVAGEARSAEDWFAQSLRRTALGKVRLTDEPIRMTAANTYWRDAVVGDNIVLVG